MDIVVVGAGAMGSTIGGLLANAGSSVSLLDVNADHMQAIAAEGLTLLHSNGKEETASPMATTDPAEIGQADVVLVMTKTWSTIDAVRSIQHSIGPHTWVVSAQNGLGNGERIVTAGVADRQVMAGTTTIGATYRDPGVVEVSGTVTANTSLTQFGLPPTRGDMASTAPVVAAFEQAGLHTEVLDDVEMVIWTKLCMAGTAGCLTALAQITIGDMLESPSALRTWRAMLGEALDVAHAEGVLLDADYVTDHAMTTYRTVGRHWASMAVDVRERRRTEIDAMCGEISARGRRHGIATPVNSTIGNMILAIEQSWTAASA